MRYSELLVDDVNEWAALSDSFVPMGHRYREPRNWWSTLTAQDTPGYALVYSENGLSPRILGRFAESPEGPWSAPVLLHTCPEMKADKKVFTYAAKAHPHLGGERELVVSYVVNSFDLAPVINDATLYWPRFVRVTLK